jgi:hypothetical protein
MLLNRFFWRCDENMLLPYHASDCVPQSFDSMRRDLGLQRFVFAGHRCAAGPKLGHAFARV